jgi:hypothetical protein
MPASLTFVPTTLQTCAGSPISFTVNVSGATSATLTSSGSGVFSQSVITGLSTVIYTPSVADATSGTVTLRLRSADPDGVGSCIARQVARVLTINPAPSLTVTSATVCSGQLASLMASGGSTYRWSNGATTQSISVSVAGAYSVTGVTAQGCSATAVGTATIESLPTLSLRRRLQVRNNTAILSASGCVGGTVNWSNGVSNQMSITVAAPLGLRQSFTAICTTTNGCSTLATITLNRRPDGNELSVNNAQVCGTSSVVLSASGCIGGSFEWSTGATSSEVTVAGVAGSYTVVCTDALGIQEAVATVSLGSGPGLVLSAGSTTTTEGSSVTLIAQATPAGSYSYVWQGPAGISLSPGSSSGVVTSGLPAGLNTFTVTVSDAGGCSSTATVCVSVPVTVCAGSDYGFTLDAPAGFASYEWRYTAPGSSSSTVVQSGTASSYVATQAGQYNVQANGSGGNTCPNGSCCPIIIQEIAMPALPNIAPVAASCSSQSVTVPNADGQLILSTTAVSGLRYNVVKGSSYTASAPLLSSDQALPTAQGAVLMSGLTNPTAVGGDVYTVRLMWRDCYQDVQVRIPFTQCDCPEVKCAPFVIQKTRSSRGGIQRP